MTQNTTTPDTSPCQQCGAPVRLVPLPRERVLTGELTPREFRRHCTNRECMGHQTLAGA